LSPACSALVAIDWQKPIVLPSAMAASNSIEAWTNSGFSTALVILIVYIKRRRKGKLRIQRARTTPQTQNTFRTLSVDENDTTDAPNAHETPLLGFNHLGGRPQC
jgi:hypothetical protein